MAEQDGPLYYKSGFERHLQSVLLGLVLLLMGWVGSTLINVGKSVAIIEFQNGAMSAQLAGMYRAADAQRDKADADRVHNEARQRLDRLEGLHESAAQPPRR